MPMIAILAVLVVQSQNSGWQPLPLITAEQRKAGFTGGEGAQWPRSIAVDSTGSFLVLGIDVGGIYRSRDGGQKWEPANVGYTPRGSSCVAIDPFNPKRVLSVGVNSSPLTQNGLYLSEDGAASWRSVLPVEMGGDEQRDQLAFDPSSYDPGSKETKRVFWSRIKRDKPSWGPERNLAALLLSEDAGRTWKELKGQEQLGGQILRFDPKGKWLYAAGEEGLWRVNPQSLEKTKVIETPTTGVDVNPQRPGWVWASTKDSLRVSEDFGSTWRSLSTNGLVRPDSSLRWIKVSPIDANRLSVWSDQSPNGWDWPRFFSHDGGRTWTRSEKDSKGAFLPDNTRQGFTVWHPKNPQIAWSWGGDWPTKSLDGGKTFRYAGQGMNAVLVGGHFNFTKTDHDIIFFGSQDYNGAMTLDGGQTWSYKNVSGNGWGGFCYGGYALSREVLFVGNAEGWGAPRKLKVSRDSGQTWQELPYENKGLDVSTGWSKDPARGFLGNLMTKDSAKSWTVMPGCDAVFAEAKDGRLFGTKRGDVWTLVVSRDGGTTWQKAADLPADVSDMAWDEKRQRLYIAASLNAYSWEGGRLTQLMPPVDQLGSRRIRSVAVDPVNSDVVYLGSAANIYTSSTSVQRSLDGGKTWQNLTMNSPLSEGKLDGGREALVVRVHPKTRRLYVSTSCFGLWTHSAP